MPAHGRLRSGSQSVDDPAARIARSIGGQERQAADATCCDRFPEPVRYSRPPERGPPILLDLLLATATSPAGIGVLATGLALGIRHGIDWDHIAAITDITTTAAASEEEADWLVREPGLMLTDESHHTHRAAVGVASATLTPVAVGVGVPSPHTHSLGETAHRHNGQRAPGYTAVDRFVRKQRPALVLGTMYALGH